MLIDTMKKELREDAEAIVREAIQAVKPDEAVRRALEKMGKPDGRLYLAAVGKAGWQMAEAAARFLGHDSLSGIVITKYGHVQGEIMGVRCYEAGHPIPDENGFLATEAVLALTENLNRTDTVLFLLSGGGSALFEKPLVSPEELQSVTEQLLESGADIVEINTIRKRLSAVKGGKFAKWCYPARVEAVILSDVLGDPVDMIASGPVSPDSSTSEQAMSIAKKYAINLSEAARNLLKEETPKTADHVHAQVIGSVSELCRAAVCACRKRGYEPVVLTDRLDCEAREAGRFLGAILKSHADRGKKLAFIAGGETVVHVTGDGLGGRNQELALAAAPYLCGLSDAAVISVGSDGTDGPTDAAGGYVDEKSMENLRKAGFELSEVFLKNDAYHALDAVGGLVRTGPTGTNVNDIAIAFCGNQH